MTTNTSQPAAGPITRDIELVRDALQESMIWCPSEWDNEKPCLIRDAMEAFERLLREGNLA